jgi:2-haloacid dehalogenase
VRGGAALGVIALDVYGTLVDTAGIAVELRKVFGAQADSAARLWREKQLEYTFRRGLMQRYEDFDTCTRQALAYVRMSLGASMDAAAERALLEAYLRLPAFADVPAGLAELKRTGHELVALSNGTERSVRAVLQHAGICDFLGEILTVERLRTFKPAPAVYALLAREGVERAWLVSANPFDVIGAKAYGLNTAWLRRDPQRVFDPWEFAPDIVVSDLPSLSDELSRARGGQRPPQAPGT